MRIVYCFRDFHNPLRICGFLRKVPLQQLPKLLLIKFDDLRWHDTRIERFEILAPGKRHHDLMAITFAEAPSPLTSRSSSAAQASSACRFSAAKECRM
jgi:hypothetical protein